MTSHPLPSWNDGAAKATILGKEFPPRQKPASFNVDEVVEKRGWYARQ